MSRVIVLPPRKKARIDNSTEKDKVIKCPVCFLLLCQVKTCGRGHSVCGACHKKLMLNQASSTPSCPICRNQDVWYPNLILDELLSSQHPKEYVHRQVQLMLWPELKAYILKHIDSEFAYQQTEKEEILNPAMDVTVVRQVLKMARVDVFAEFDAFVPPLNMSSLVFTFLPVTGLFLYPVSTGSPTDQMTKLLAQTSLLYNTACFYIQQQFFLVTCRYQLADNNSEGNDDAFEDSID